MDKVKETSITRNVYSTHFKSVLGGYIGFAVILITSYIISPASFSVQDFINLLKQSSGLGITAIGQTLVIMTGGIDLSLGSIITLVHVVTIGSMQGDPSLILPVCLAGLAIGSITGFVNGFGVAKARIAPLIMTLCSDFILRGLFMIYTKGQPKGVLAESFRSMGRFRVFGIIPISVIVWLLLSALFIFIVKRTTFGAKIKMVGANPACSRISGVRNDRVIILVYTLAGLLAALTAIVLTMDMSAASLNLGADYSMDSIASTVVGGTLFAGGIGGVEGTISGVLIIRLITSLLQKANVVNWAKLIVQSGIILAVVALYARKEKR
jgi:ribose/xylose/arabinose/galactoside ABC-type transport system permease subunit